MLSFKEITDWKPNHECKRMVKKYMGVPGNKEGTSEGQGNFQRSENIFTLRKLSERKCGVTYHFNWVQGTEEIVWPLFHKGCLVLTNSPPNHDEKAAYETQAVGFQADMM